MFRGSILKKGKDGGIAIISRQDGKDTQRGYYKGKISFRGLTVGMSRGYWRN